MVENECESNCESHETNTVNNCPCETTTATGTRKTASDSSDCSSCCCSTDPIGAAKSLLESSFFAALKQVHVEKLKQIIEKEWGSTIDKAVELTIKTVAKQWQASLSKSGANKEFYTELEKIFATAK